MEEAMSLDECISILVEHNAWRRGKYPYDDKTNAPYKITPKQLGEAVDCAVRALKDIVVVNRISRQDVIRAVEKHTNTSISHIKSTSRVFARQRQILYYILRTYRGDSYPAIARILSVDHTTVIHGVKRITSLRMKDDVLADILDDIEEDLNLIPEQKKSPVFDFARDEVNARD
jgi:hypothetical protein